MSGSTFHKIRNLASTDFTRNSAKLLSANIIAQAIGLLIYPILTRIYIKDDFGLISLFLSIGSIATLFATAEYQYAIMLPKSEKRAQACFQVSFIICLLVTLGCLLTVPLAKPIAGLFNAPELANWYFLLPIFVFLSGVWTLLNYWYTRHKKFTNISTYQVTQSIFGAGGKYGFGLIELTSGGLIISTVLAPFLSILISIAGAYKKSLKLLFTFDKNECKIAAKQYANFPKFSLPRAIINNFSGNLPILLLTPFFGLAEIGFFAMALTLAFRPINMISSSLYQVFFQRTSERVQNKLPIMLFFKKFIRNTLVLIIPCFCILYFILPWLSETILGAGWHITGEYIQIIIPWLIMSVLVAPICYLSDIFQKQKCGLYFEILLVFCRIIGIGVGIYFQSFTIAIIGYVISSSIIILAQLIWYIHLVNVYEKSLR